tara:strand:- start:65240 stop:65524 length:285 start_codon:yes stop_codon:yes gene_type:complete
MRKLAMLMLLLISVSVYARPLKETLRSVEIDKNAKCFKTKESVVVCLTSRCVKNYDYLCVANSGEFDLRLRVNVYKNMDGEVIEDVTKIIYLNK